MTATDKATVRRVRDLLTGRNVVRAAQFYSRSDPTKIYTVQHYADGTCSCNCPAWTRRVLPDGSRHCKHLP